jgi:hypothetical protein
VEGRGAVVFLLGYAKWEREREAWREESPLPSLLCRLGAPDSEKSFGVPTLKNNMDVWGSGVGGRNDGGKGKGNGIQAFVSIST